jgi:hypothetical protein
MHVSIVPDSLPVRLCDRPLMYSWPSSLLRCGHQPHLPERTAAMIGWQVQMRLALMAIECASGGS